MAIGCFFFFSSRRRHTRCSRDWSSDVCSSDLHEQLVVEIAAEHTDGGDAGLAVTDEPIVLAPHASGQPAKMVELAVALRPLEALAGRRPRLRVGRLGVAWRLLQLRALGNFAVDAAQVAESIDAIGARAERAQGRAHFLYNVAPVRGVQFVHDGNRVVWSGAFTPRRASSPRSAGIRLLSVPTILTNRMPAGSRYVTLAWSGGQEAVAQGE